VYPGTDTLDKLYVLCRDGLYEVNTVPAAWTARRVWRGGNAANYQRRTLIVHDGKLTWNARQVDAGPMVLFTMDNTNGVQDIQERVGLNYRDGIPTTVFGPASWMVSAGNHLLVSAGGMASGRNAHILGNNRKGGHTRYVHATDNLPIDFLAVTGSTILFAVRTGSTTHAVYQIANALTAPVSGVTLKYQATSYVDTSEYDGGMPTTGGALLGVALDAHGLSETDAGEYVNVDYDTDEIDYGSFTNLGDILSGDKDLSLASGAGVSATSFALRLNLIRDAADIDESPHVHSLEIRYQKVPTILEGFSMEIDLAASAALLGPGTKIGTALTNLKAARDSAILVPFRYPGTSAAIYVKVLDFALDLDWQGEGPEQAPANAMAQHSGFVKLRIEQRV